MHVRIFKPAKNAMQSGRANSKRWILEFEPITGARPDPLMGWSSSPDTRRQIRLNFESEVEAIEFAKENGYTFTVVKRNERKIQPKSYSDNFAFSRIEPWTH